MCAGATTTTIYPSTIADDVAFILSDSGSVIAFAEDAKQVEKLRDIRDTIPCVRKVVVIDGEGDGDWVMPLAELEALGAGLLAEDPGVVDARIDASQPDHLATIIYTSGTTGRPKGRPVAPQGVDLPGIGDRGDPHPPARRPAVLAAARPRLRQAVAHHPLAVGFPTVIDGRVDKIVENLPSSRRSWPPCRGSSRRSTAMSPLAMQKEGGVREALFNWATGVGGKVSELTVAGKSPGMVLGAQHALADRLVLSTVRNRFGGNIRFSSRLRRAQPGDLPVVPPVGLLVAEGYGLTETNSAAYVNRVVAYKIGSAGWPLPGLRRGIAEDGEILLRGEGIMQGITTTRGDRRGARRGGLVPHR